MAKKNNQSTAEAVEVIAPDTDKKSKTNTKGNAKVDQKTKVDPKAKKIKNKKEKKSLKKKASEVLSELKKVSKPSFGTVVKNTCVVIAVVAICTILLFGVDKLFSLVYDLLLPNS